MTNALHDEALESVMSQLGEFGKYQLCQHVLHLLAAYLAAVHMLSFVWTAPTPEHRCQINDLDGTNSSQNLSQHIPFDPMTGDLDSCMVYNTPGDPSGGVRACGGPYVFKKDFYESSRVIDLGLVCDKRWMRALLQSLYMLGVLCGSFTFGSLADSFGRKPIFYMSAIFQLIFGVICAFVPTYWMLAVAMFFYGAFGSGGSFVTGFVLSMELVGQSKRTVCGTMFSVFFALGVMSDSLLGWLIPGKHQYLQLAFACNSVILLGHWWLIDESIRWLWSKGRTEEALHIAKRALAVNGKTLVTDSSPESQMTKYTFTSASNGHTIPTYRESSLGKEIKSGHHHPSSHGGTGVADIFRHPNLRRRILIISYAWFANSLVYYGLSFSVGSLPGNPFLISFLSGLSEVPGFYIIVILLAERLGRRCMQAGTMLVGGIACVIIALLDSGLAVIGVAVLAKVFVSASFALCYIYTAELAPTVIRNSVMGITMMAARGAGMIAPSIYLLDEFGKAVPTLLYGGLGILAAFLSLLLPETLNKELPQNMDDAEDFGKGDPPFYAAICNLRRPKKNERAEESEDSKENESMIKNRQYVL